ncbi:MULTISPECIES: hypothetical protein [unclassified Streptomyces]|uniref:hypothetical protein n=1 Tax=unclassified Streptomyces TaxID=2593676 RepID=UPI0035D8E0CD
MTAVDRSGVVSANEEWLIGGLRFGARYPPRDGWAYSSPSALLLAHGRLFTPARWPGGAIPGEPGQCFIESMIYAQGSGDALAYVEGWALDPDNTGETIAHAWCAGPGGLLLDPTWKAPGAAYVGLPVVPSVAAGLMSDCGGPLLHSASGLVSPVTERWMREGIPEGVLVDVGRPIAPR